MIINLILLIFIGFMSGIHQSSIDRNYDLLIQLKKDNLELRNELAQLKILMIAQEKVLESFVIEEEDQDSLVELCDK